MKIALLHNNYQQPGGEDVVVRAEEELLRAHGHRVVEYTRHNDEIKDYGIWKMATLGPRTTWAWDSYREIKALLERERPDVAHLHNTLPLISPAAYYACREAGVPVVQTLHNYRLLCANTVFLRNGEACRRCLGRTVPWPAVLHGCYRGNRAASAAVASMVTVHRALGTWTGSVDIYITLTEVARHNFVNAGLPPDKIVVKPNFVHPDPGYRRHSGGYALFVGRLSPDKGLQTLLAAWQRLSREVPLRIVGDGPLSKEVAAASRRIHGLEWLGHRPAKQVLDVLGEAAFLVLARGGIFGLALVGIEAFARATPLVASRIGAVAELVEDQRTGLHFTPGDPDDLAAKVEWAWTHPAEMEAMGHAARAEYEAKYTAERNYQMLMEIYRKVLKNRNQKSGDRKLRSE